MYPELVGYCNNIPKVSSSNLLLPVIILIPRGSALVFTTFTVCGLMSSETIKVDLFPLRILQAILIDSAAAVASSRRDAFEISIPVRSQTIVWKFKSASNLPCAISA